MLTELLLFVPLFIGYRMGLLNIYVCLFIVLFCYWLPKPVFISAIESFFPSIRTRLLHMYNEPKQIALTFDDVPYDTHTYKKIIDTLDKFNMKGTFFVISDYLSEESTGLLAEAVKNGHQLANHGRTNSMHYLKNMNELTTEIVECDKKIIQIYERANVTLPKIKFYRPGCGFFGSQMLDVVNKLKHTLVLGSVYPNDPMFPSSTLNYWYLTNHIEEGDIVILHDRTWTPPMLEKLLPWLKKNGYESVTLNKLLIW